MFFSSVCVFILFIYQKGMLYSIVKSLSNSIFAIQTEVEHGSYSIECIIAT